MIEPIPSRVAVLESQVTDIKQDTTEMKIVLYEIKAYIEADKAKNSLIGKVGYLLTMIVGGVAGAITSHIRIG